MRQSRGDRATVIVGKILISVADFDTSIDTIVHLIAEGVLAQYRLRPGTALRSSGSPCSRACRRPAASTKGASPCALCNYSVGSQIWLELMSNQLVLWANRAVMACAAVPSISAADKSAQTPSEPKHD